MTRASERLHVSQPALSVQIAALEDEFGHKLFNRSTRKLTLTSKGIELKRRADDLVDLAHRIEEEMKATSPSKLEGTLSIGAGETPAFRFIARAAKKLRTENPQLGFFIISGNAEHITSQLREGTLDLGLLIGPGRYDDFEYMALPYTHSWCLVVARDSPLAAKSYITPKDIKSIPIISPRQPRVKEVFTNWLGYPFSRLNIVSTFNLIYNATLFVEAGLGAAICIDGMMPQELTERVVVLPFSPALTCDVYFAWRKNVVLPPAARALIEAVQAEAGKELCTKTEAPAT